MRDVMIGAPIFWMRDTGPAVLCVLVALATWIVPLRWWPERALEWFDGAGLAAYAVHGASKALGLGIAPVPAVAAGVVTACLGGVIRDILTGVPSVLMRHELYVTAALFAAALFVIMTGGGIGAPLPAYVAVALGFALRAAASRWHLTLPPHRGA